MSGNLPRLVSNPQHKKESASTREPYVYAVIFQQGSRRNMVLVGEENDKLPSAEYNPKNEDPRNVLQNNMPKEITLHKKPTAKVGDNPIFGGTVLAKPPKGFHFIQVKEMKKGVGVMKAFSRSN